MTRAKSTFKVSNGTSAACLRRTTRIAVVDPQPMYRAGMVRVVSSRATLQVAGEGGTLADALALAQRGGIDVLILDVALDTEFTAIAELRLRSPEMAIIAVGRTEVEGIAEAMRAGVKGCLPRSIDGPGLLDAIERVVRGEMYVAPCMGWQLLSRLTSGRSAARAEPQILQFTSREEEIMHLVALGATNKEVARKLVVSVKTVKHHLTNVMQKLRVRNRVEAVMAYRARGADPASRPRIAVGL